MAGLVSCRLNLVFNVIYSTRLISRITFPCSTCRFRKNGEPFPSDVAQRASLSHTVPVQTLLEPRYAFPIHPLCIMKSNILFALLTSICVSSQLSRCHEMSGRSYPANTSGLFLLQKTALLHRLLDQSFFECQVRFRPHMQHVAELNLLLT